MKYNLSLIIPIYKVEDYIKNCLDSIFHQLPDNVEIILINDGTPDKSIDIIRSMYSDWLCRDQVVLIEQDNAGPGAARNRGIEICHGNYIGFLDSDDILLKDYFEVVLAVLKDHNPDVVEFGYKRFSHQSEVKLSSYKPPYAFKGLTELNQVRNEIFSIGVWFPSIRVYKKELFDRLRFPKKVFYEDLMTIPYIYFQDLTLYVIDKPLIGYRVNPTSTTATHTKSHLNNIYEFYKSLNKLENSIPVKILKIKIARSIVYFYIELNVLDFPIDKVLSDIKKIKKNLILLRNLKTPDLMFFIFPKLYILLDRIRLKNTRKTI